MENKWRTNRKRMENKLRINEEQMENKRRTNEEQWRTKWNEGEAKENKEEQMLKYLSGILGSVNTQLTRIRNV